MHLLSLQVSATQYATHTFAAIDQFPTMQRSGRNVDFATFLLPPGTADVFFPTQFQNVAQLWRAAGAASRHVAAQNSPSVVAGVSRTATDVMPTHAFMNMYAETARTKTMSAYNPLLDDFHNTSILLADSM